MSAPQLTVGNITFREFAAKVRLPKVKLPSPPARVGDPLVAIYESLLRIEAILAARK